MSMQLKWHIFRPWPRPTLKMWSNTQKVTFCVMLFFSNKFSEKKMLQNRRKTWPRILMWINEMDHAWSISSIIDSKIKSFIEYFHFEIGWSFLKNSWIQFVLFFFEFNKARGTNPSWSYLFPLIDVPKSQFCFSSWA